MTLKFWAAPYKNASNPRTCWNHGLYGHKLQSFSSRRVSKNAEKSTIVLWITACEKYIWRNPTSCNPTQNRAFLWHILSSKKVRQPIGRKDSIQTVILTSRRLDSFLYEAAQNFEVFPNIQKGNLKNQKHIAVDVLFKAYPMVPLSCRSNLAGPYL